MRIKCFVSMFVLITFLSGAFFVSNSYADSKERDEIKKAIDKEMPAGAREIQKYRRSQVLKGKSASVLKFPPKSLRKKFW